MRGHHTVTRKFYPVRIQRRYLRTVRGKNRYTPPSDKKDSVSITLKDLGDIDVNELNTIPSSIDEGGVSPWKEVPDVNTDERPPCPNPLFQVNSGKFCPFCTAELVKIHGNSSSSDTCCIHKAQTEDEVLAKARSFFEQNVMNLLNDFEEGTPVNFNPGKKILRSIAGDDGDKKTTSKKQDNTKLLARGLPPENKITCSMSKLSMQAFLCTSESTISAVISEVVQTPPSLLVWSSSSDDKLFGQRDEERKLKLLCGELLLQLCKATTGNAMKSEAADKTITGSITNSTGGNLIVPTTSSQEQKQGDHDSTTITQQVPDWLQEVTRSRSQPGIQQKNELPFQGKTMKHKAPTKCFKPLLCTKLSVPWRGRKHSSQQYAMHLKTKQPKVNLADDNSAMSVKSVSSLTEMDDSKEQIPEATEMCNYTGRNRDLKPKQELPKRKKELREPEVCAKCKTSIRSIQQNNPVKIKPTKSRREGTHNRWSSNRRTRQSKERRAKRRRGSNTRGGAVPENSDTKYFIKSFFTGTSSETTPKTKSKGKTSRNLFMKTNARRKKSTFTLPHSLTVGQAGLNYTKKPEQAHDRLPGRINSKDDVEFLMNKELKMINKHVKAHEKQLKEASAPMFHTCFKHILSREFKNKLVHARKPTAQQRDSSHHKRPRGVGNVSGFPQQLEKRKFNDSLFSCLIPRVFK